jgi:hypothetical protein
MTANEVRMDARKSAVKDALAEQYFEFLAGMGLTKHLGSKPQKNWLHFAPLAAGNMSWMSAVAWGQRLAIWPKHTIVR